MDKIEIDYREKYAAWQQASREEAELAMVYHKAVRRRDDSWRELEAVAALIPEEIGKRLAKEQWSKEGLAPVSKSLNRVEMQWLRLMLLWAGLICLLTAIYASYVGKWNEIFLFGALTVVCFYRVNTHSGTLKSMSMP